MSEFDDVEFEPEVIDSRIEEPPDEELELSDLEAAIEDMQSEEEPLIEINNQEQLIETAPVTKTCVPCSTGKLECNFCDKNNEWPAGRTCKMCDGTGYRR